MIVIDCTVDPQDLTLELLVEQFDRILDMNYTFDEMIKIDIYGFPIVRVKCYPDEIWITQWQQNNIFSGKGEPWKRFRDVPLKVKFKEL